MNDREFTVIASRLVWGEAIEEASHPDTLKRLKALLEEREQLLATLEDITEKLVSSHYWAEHDGHVKSKVTTVSGLQGEGATHGEATVNDPSPKLSETLKGFA